MEEKATRKSHMDIDRSAEQIKENIRKEKEIKEKADKTSKRKIFIKSLPKSLNVIFLNVFSLLSSFFIMIAAGICLMNLWKSNAPAWVNILAGCAFIFTMMFFNERLSKE